MSRSKLKHLLCVNVANLLSKFLRVTAYAFGVTAYFKKFREYFFNVCNNISETPRKERLGPKELMP